MTDQDKMPAHRRTRKRTHRKRCTRTHRKKAHGGFLSNRAIVSIQQDPNDYSPTLLVDKETADKIFESRN